MEKGDFLDDEVTAPPIIEEPGRTALEAEVEIANSVIRNLRKEIGSLNAEIESYRLENSKLKLALKRLIHKEEKNAPVPKK